MFIDRIYRINHTETWNFNAPTLVTSVSHKIMAKCGILCPETLLLTEKQLHAIQFFLRLAMFAPWRSQNPVRKTWVSGYWKIIHSNTSCSVWIVGRNGRMGCRNGRFNEQFQILPLELKVKFIWMLSYVFLTVLDLPARFISATLHVDKSLKMEAKLGDCRTLGKFTEL